MSNFEDETTSSTPADAVEVTPATETGAEELVVAEDTTTDATVEVSETGTADVVVEDSSEEQPASTEPQAYQPTPSDGKPV